MGDWPSHFRSRGGGDVSVSVEVAHVEPTAQSTAHCQYMKAELGARVMMDPSHDYITTMMLQQTSTREVA